MGAFWRLATTVPYRSLLKASDGFPPPLESNTNAWPWPAKPGMNWPLPTVQSHHVLLFFWLCRLACGILVPQPGIEPVPPAVEAQSRNHWTAREVPRG